MKLLCSCPLCKDDQARDLSIYLGDEGAAFATCFNRHEFVVISPHDKFEILFDSGSLALLDEYPREAVTSFAGALEQFFGFFVRVVTRTIDEWLALAYPSDMKREGADQELRLAWKGVAAQSERQLGAFLFLHLIATGKAYELDKDLVELRNRVVHRGYLPTLDEATAFGQKVWTEINSLLWYLFEYCQTGLLGEDEDRMTKLKQSLPPGFPTLELPHAMMLSYRKPDQGDTFSERLFRLRTRWRGDIYGRGPR